MTETKFSIMVALIVIVVTVSFIWVIASISDMNTSSLCAQLAFESGRTTKVYNRACFILIGDRYIDSNRLPEIIRELEQ
jgi:hypothetical protein